MSKLTKAEKKALRNQGEEVVKESASDFYNAPLGEPFRAPAAVDLPESETMEITVEGPPSRPRSIKIVEYAFPSKSKCPRCKSLDTVAVSTQKNIQYRLCRVAICRWKYTVLGEKV